MRTIKTRTAIKLLRLAMDRGLFPEAEIQVALAELQGLDAPGQLPPTKRGLEVLRGVHEHRRQAGLSPTMAELAAKLGVSRPTVHEHLRILVERGHLHRTGPNRSRNYLLTQRGLLALHSTKRTR